ncbi:MAG: DUF945 domain-containing protein [Bacilli bacterium]|nr:DUF945 domain-containing protein [Bacilli bacterium]
MSNSFFSSSSQRNANRVAFRNIYGAWNNTEGKILPIADVIKEAKCNYEVDKQTLVRITPAMLDAIRNGYPVEGLTQNDIITTHCATRRTDNDVTLGVVGNDYGVVQNEKAFEFIDYLQKYYGQESVIETAGALGDGERIYVTCRLKKEAYLDDSKKDPLNNYFIFTTSHDGGGSVKAYSSTIRVVCQNTLNQSLLKKADSLSYRHSKNVNERLNYEVLVPKFIENSESLRQNFMIQMNKLRSEEVDANYVKDFAAQIFLKDTDYKEYLKADRKIDDVDTISTRTRNQIEKLENSIDFGIGQEMYRGTKLWVLNGLTTMIHNDTEYKSEEDEFLSIMEGTSAKRLEKAYKILEIA